MRLKKITIHESVIKKYAKKEMDNVNTCIIQKTKTKYKRVLFD